jgi:hypothetical protein
MSDGVELVLRGVLIGVGASALMDVWSLLLRRWFGVPTLDYAMLGRWIGHFPRGHFLHERVASAAPIAGERLLGWLAHYAIGIAFALLLLAIWGLDWARSPTIGPPLLIALGTIAAPWFVMQPTPRPGLTRLRNVGTHAVYGLGLYVSALALSLL